ncbi:hypothetical protein ACFWTC_03005 [Streptomyces sp. NPDC058619]|uniref:hypothetical protein n=1 Tax=unclassified Streptomyces TaxID=2593676 RepID=UPI00366238F6
MRVRKLINLFRKDQARDRGIIAGQAVKIRDLEGKLADAQATSKPRPDDNTERIEHLEEELTKQARLIDQLRAGVVDDAQTNELRRQITDLRTANKALHREVTDLTAANSGIPQIAEVSS